MDASKELLNQTCVPCKAGTAPFKGEEIQKWLKKLGNGWKVVDEHHLEKSYSFPDFRQALIFTNEIGEMSELENHHPDIHMGWGRAKLLIWTHKINGLSPNDFILAAKCDKVVQNMKPSPVCF